MYYVDVFTQFKNNIKQTWKVIKESLHKNKFAKISQRFCYLGKIIDNPQDIANAFNTFFINIGPSIAEQIQSRGSHKTYLKASHSSTLNLANIDEGYIASLIDSLNKHIKAAKNVTAKPLTLMINQMLNTRIFPDKLKQSKVIPIFKANYREFLSNYRLI